MKQVTISSVEEIKDAYTIELSRGMFSTTFGGNYSLKFSIDLNKYRYSTQELVKHVFLKIFGIEATDEEKFKPVLDLEGLIDYVTIKNNFDNFLKDTRCVTPRRAAVNAGLFQVVDTETTTALVPGKKSEVIFEFKFNKENKNLVFDSVKYSVMDVKPKECLAKLKWGKPPKDSYEYMPVYATKSKKLKIEIPSPSLTIDNLQATLSPNSEFPEFIALHTFYFISTMTFYGFDVVTTRPGVSKALDAYLKSNNKDITTDQ